MANRDRGDISQQSEPTTWAPTPLCSYESPPSHAELVEITTADLLVSVHVYEYVYHNKQLVSNAHTYNSRYSSLKKNCNVEGLFEGYSSLHKPIHRVQMSSFVMPHAPQGAEPAT